MELKANCADNMAKIKKNGMILFAFVHFYVPFNLSKDILTKVFTAFSVAIGSGKLILATQVEPSCWVPAFTQSTCTEFAVS